MTTALATKSDLPEPVARRGVTEAKWRTLCNNLYPGARPESILMVLDYCAARNLDPMKKPCHIVPMEVKDAKTNKYEWRDVVLPGVYELRTTAMRSEAYMGHSEATWGPEIDYRGIRTFEWCAMTFYRWHAPSRTRIEFPVRVFFREVVALNKEGKANARWSRAPLQMLQKCTEAAGLREVCPDELGGEPSADEMEGQRAAEGSTATVEVVTVPKPDRFDDWLIDMTAVADEGEALFAQAWAAAPAACREYLTQADPSAWNALRARVTAADAARRSGSANETDRGASA